MAPLTNILSHISRRGDSAILSISAPNPLKDHNFINTVVGLVVGAAVFLLLLILILVLYRENSPQSMLRATEDLQIQRPAKEHRPLSIIDASADR
jgi:hypothetical protein